MALITRAAFAKIAKVAPKQITVGIQAGRLTPGRDGFIDTAAPKNKAYLKRHGVSYREKRSKEDDVPLQIRKVLADIADKEQRAAYTAQRRAQALGMLVERAIVEQMFAQFGQELKLRLLDLPRRIAPQLAAVVKAGGGPRAVEEKLDAEIADVISHAKEKARGVGLGSLGR